MPLSFFRPSRLFAVVGLPACIAAAQAQVAPSAVFVQAGHGEDNVRMGSIGVLWPWAWRTPLAGGEVTVQTELFASQWRARDFAGGHQTFTQLGVVPLFRWRGAGGQSPWFLEAGIGVSVTDRRFVTPDKTFGSSFNFSDNLAIGGLFGSRSQHELSLRWQHTSNAGLKKPNPGLDTVLVRYAHRF